MIEFPIPPRVERICNPEIVDILRNAKKHVWDGKDLSQLRQPQNSRYICNAIDIYWGSLSDPTDELRQHIRVLKGDIEATLHSLCVMHTYGTWVTDTLTGRGEYAALTSPNATLCFQTGRLRWVDQLIEEYGGTHD